jgi:heat shock protein HspQ
MGLPAQFLFIAAEHSRFLPLWKPVWRLWPITIELKYGHERSGHSLSPQRISASCQKYPQFVSQFSAGSTWTSALWRFISKLQRVVTMLRSNAKFNLGQVVRHKKHPFRGVVFDIDPQFSNTEEWYAAIPEGSRPVKEQPFYHLLAENDQSYYVAYVSEQNLLADTSGEPVDHPDLDDLFGDFEDGQYPLEYQLN